MCYIAMHCGCSVAGGFCFADDPQNLKALYRRGQAYAALQQHAQAKQDLEVSLQLSASDPQQQQLIREKLKYVREKLAAEQQQQEKGSSSSGAAGPAAAAAAGGAAVAAAGQEEDGLIEEVQEESDDQVPDLEAEDDEPALGAIGEPAKQQQQQQQPPSSRSAELRRAAAAGSNSSSSAAGGGSLAEMQARAAEMMRANPDLARQVRLLKEQ
jgi:hypothetical protein